MATTSNIAAFLGRSLLRTVAVLVSLAVLVSAVGVVLLVSTNPPSPRAGGYVFFALVVAGVVVSCCPRSSSWKRPSTS